MTDLATPRPRINFDGVYETDTGEIKQLWEIVIADATAMLEKWVGIWESDPAAGTDGWVCTVTDTMLSALDGDKIGSDADVEFRSDALVGLVMQLVTAIESGSQITVDAVINVARAAFPVTYYPDTIARIGAAGMCVMWAQARPWFDAHRHEFGVAVLSLAEGGATIYRPDAFRGLA